MADGTVDNLNIQISAEARSAEKSLNSLSSTLLKVNKDLLSSVGSIRKVSKEVGTLKSAIDSLGKVNMNSSGVNKTLNSFKRMLSADMRNFDPTAFQNVLNSLQAFRSIPDVSNNINRFVSSIDTGCESVATLYRFNELKQLYHLAIRLSIAFSCWKMNDLKTNRQKHPNSTQKKPRL